MNSAAAECKNAAAVQSEEPSVPLMMNQAAAECENAAAVQSEEPSVPAEYDARYTAEDGALSGRNALQTEPSDMSISFRLRPYCRSSRRNSCEIPELSPDRRPAFHRSCSGSRRPRRKIMFFRNIRRMAYNSPFKKIKCCYIILYIFLAKMSIVDGELKIFG